MALWMQTSTTTGPPQVLFSMGTWDEGSGSIACGVMDGNRVAFRSTGSSTPTLETPAVSDGGPNVRDGNWHFIVGQQDGERNRQILIDGQLAASDSFSPHRGHP